VDICFHANDWKKQHTKTKFSLMQWIKLIFYLLNIEKKKKSSWENIQAIVMHLKYLQEHDKKNSQNEHKHCQYLFKS
jgi:hypothetical protein